MNKQEQIEEMSYELLDHTCMSSYQAEIASNVLYELGYRRQDEVARDIFSKLEEEIEVALKSNYRARTEHLNKYPENYNLEIVSNIHGKINALRGIQSFISILKIEYGVME